MKRIVLMVSLLVLAAGFAAAQTDANPVALVRGLMRSEPITVRQLRSETELLVRQQLMAAQAQATGQQRVPTPDEMARAMQSLSAENRRQVLEQMINQRLVLQAAEQARVTVTDNDLLPIINQYRQLWAAQNGRAPTDAEFEAYIRENTGLDMASYREQLRKTAIANRFFMSKYQNEINAIAAPTEAEITAYFNSHRDVRPEYVKVSLILVPPGTDRTAARAQADRLASQIGQDAQKFNETMTRGSAANSNLGYRGGELGYVPRDPSAEQRLGSAFVSAIFGLRDGAISGVLESSQGFVIARVTERWPAKMREMDDIYAPGDPMTVHDYIAQGLRSQRQQEVAARRQQELLTELRAGNPFTIYEDRINF